MQETAEQLFFRGQRHAQWGIVRLWYMLHSNCLGPGRQLCTVL